jgi:hypothetical protein
MKRLLHEMYHFIQEKKHKIGHLRLNVVEKVMLKLSYDAEIHTEVPTAIVQALENTAPEVAATLHRPHDSTTNANPGQARRGSRIILQRP